MQGARCRVRDAMRCDAMRYDASKDEARRIWRELRFRGSRKIRRLAAGGGSGTGGSGSGIGSGGGGGGSGGSTSK